MKDQGLSIMWPPSQPHRSVRLDQLMAGESRFPLYHLALWYIDGETNRQSLTGVTHMVSHQLDLREKTELVEKFIEAQMTTPSRWREDKLSLKERGSQFLTASIRFAGWETWVLQWFCHATRNTHLSDRDLRDSFGRFVRRKMGQYDYYLMGAQESWRWSEPCRCEHCTEQGVVRINH